MILDRGYVHGGDVYSQPVRLDFSANVNPYGAPEAVKAAVREAASKLTDYPDPYCGPLREKLAALNGVDRENVICGNGAAELIYQFAAALRPKKALLPVPSFADYEGALAAAGCSPTLHPLRRENGFLLT
jgi:threonine-phosphate decarboxylase